MVPSESAPGPTKRRARRRDDQVVAESAMGQIQPSYVAHRRALAYLQDLDRCGLALRRLAGQIGDLAKEIERIVSWDSIFGVERVAKSMKGYPGLEPLPHSVTTRFRKRRGPLGASSIVTSALSMRSGSLCAAAWKFTCMERMNH